MTTIPEIQIPHLYDPRDYQLPILEALDAGCKRAVAVWHRRAGKDKTFLNYQIKRAIREKGIYYYFFPQYAQAKKVIWNGIDKAGFKFIDHFPPEIIRAKNKTEMLIELVNGSVWQLIGTDNYDSIRGTNPIGCVFSEYPYQNPDAWQSVIKPILRENGGWAVFNYTPYGANHGLGLYRVAKANSDWYCSLLTIDDTGILTPEDMQQERAEGMSEAKIRQEYYCDFNVQIEDGLYSPDDIRACTEHEIEHPAQTPKVISIDVARSAGGDKTVIVYRCGPVIEYYWRGHTQDTMKIAQKAAEAYERYSADYINVDVIGVGAGVVDKLKQMNTRTNGINFGNKSTQPNRFQNLKAEIFWHFREIMINREVKLPKCEDLSEQLANIRYEIRGEKKIAIEKKEDLKKRIGRSPDELDAIVMAFHSPRGSAQGVNLASANDSFNRTSPWKV